MSKGRQNGTQPIVPMIAYEDADAAIDWLVQAFGFRELARIAGEDGRIGHADERLPGLAQDLDILRRHRRADLVDRQRQGFSLHDATQLRGRLGAATRKTDVGVPEQILAIEGSRGGEGRRPMSFLQFRRRVW